MSQLAAVQIVWAKTDPPKSLVHHMIDAGNVARALCETPAFATIPRRFAVAAGCTATDAAIWLAYLTAMHDIGKCHSAFQAKGSPAVVAQLADMGYPCLAEPGFRHEAVSGQWTADLLADESGWEWRSATVVGDALRGHHGSFSVDPPVPEHPTLASVWERLREDVATEIGHVFAPPPWSATMPDKSASGVILSGLVVLSDWIASNEEFFGHSDPSMRSAAYALQSLDLARQAVTCLGFGNTAEWTTGTGFTEVWGDIVTPRPVQTACEEIVRAGVEPGLAIIEAPMGEGKTEAAIYLATQWLAAGKRSGMYIALPTAATSNQMHGRVERFLGSRSGSQGVRLIHGMDWAVDEYSARFGVNRTDDEDKDRQALQWFRPKKRSLLATYGVGTIDQALMSVMHIKHGFLRLFGLAGKVLIIDEVHAYDAYMSEILLLLIRWCRALDVPAILLSATLPARTKRLLVAAYGAETNDEESVPALHPAPYPLITLVAPASRRPQEIAVAGATQRSTVEVIRHDGFLGDAEATARLAIESVAQGGCFGVVANTIRSAQCIYRAIRERLAASGDEETKTILFHARFPAERRQELEAQVLTWLDKRGLDAHSGETSSRPARAIIVATQVVEQSLDIDFDLMISELAPVDLLLQRVGRLHRHARPHRPTGATARLHVLTPPLNEMPDFGPSAFVYSRYVLLATLAELRRLDRLVLPDDIRPLVDAVYCDPTISRRLVPPAIAAAWDELQHKEADSRLQADRYLVNGPSRRRFELALKPGVMFDEDDSGATGYFAARTRQGDDTQTVLIVDSDATRQLLSLRWPSPEQLRLAMLQTVSIPRWWLVGLVAATGYEELRQGPDWLPRVTVLNLSNGAWHGRDGAGREVTIRYDRQYGLLRESDSNREVI